MKEWLNEYVKGYVKEYYRYTETYNVRVMWSNGEFSMLKGKWRNFTDIMKHKMLQICERMVKWLC
jgi:hypothetical protein